MIGFTRSYNQIDQNEPEKAQVVEETGIPAIQKFHNWRSTYCNFSYKIEGNITPWIISTVFFAILSVIASLGDGKGDRGLCGYRFGVADHSEMARTDRILGMCILRYFLGSRV